MANNIDNKDCDESMVICDDGSSADNCDTTGQSVPVSGKWPISVPPVLLRTTKTSLPQLQMKRQIGVPTRKDINILDTSSP